MRRHRITTRELTSLARPDRNAIADSILVLEGRVSTVEEMRYIAAIRALGAGALTLTSGIEVPAA